MSSNEEKKHAHIAKLPLDIVKRIYHLPDLQRKTSEIEEQFLTLNHHVVELQKDAQNIKQSAEERHDDLDHRLKVIDDRLTDAVHQLSILNERLSAAPAAGSTTTKASADTPSNTSTDLVADEHLLDNFYVHFERWFRGTEAEIGKRQSVYLPYFTDSGIDSKKFPVVDIGCGNGEFVGLLQENGIRAIGLDLNKAMIDNVVKKGLEGVQGDALSYLKGLKSNSVMAITGFHIVEHIPFLDLVKIFNECYRVLAPGGFVVFETPNPENTIVGSCNFYNDPSHLHPLPPMFLELVMKTRGFPKTEIKRLHPLKPDLHHDDPLVMEMAQRFFGPQDYSVIAWK